MKICLYCCPSSCTNLLWTPPCFFGYGYIGVGGHLLFWFIFRAGSDHAQVKRISLWAEKYIRIIHCQILNILRKKSLAS